MASKNDLKLIAQQLRKPSGEFAEKVAVKMGDGNRPLYDLVMQAMNINPDDSLLEIGFGGGDHFGDLLSMQAGIKVFGIDYSSEMVTRASIRNRKAVESGVLKLFKGNSNEMPFDDHQFDQVFCNMVIYFWEEPVEHLKEIRRVLKPDGTFYTGMRTRESMLELPFTSYGFKLYTTDEWTGILQDNGFKVTGETGAVDPPLKEGEKLIHLESRCIIAGKSS
jgi:ubiquinone/menaquinone biosynthesis C-methylase UbiE